MINNLYKSKASTLVERAKEKGLIKHYADFCKTPTSKALSLSKDEVIYYTSNKGETK